LLLSEFSDKPLREVFYKSNNFPGRHVADPFMGGGTPILEANRIGCNVTGFDINPMSWWIVKQEIEHLDLGAYAEAAESLRAVACGLGSGHGKYLGSDRIVPIWPSEIGL
jgi:putative DNA methylase